MEDNQRFGEPFGVWEGEVRAELPSRMDAAIRFIGRCRTPWTERADCPRNVGLSDASCALEIDAVYAPGLMGLEDHRWIWALYWMDRAPRDILIQVPRHGSGKRHGVFALRSPARPNPIALSALPLLGIEQRADGQAVIHTRGLDCLDGTPLIDVKPISRGDAAPHSENAS